MTDAAVTTRMAHLHLRTGLPALARVELETLAGREALSVAALADLAEARWRGGDLGAAAEAAQAHLDQGGHEILAEIVVIEAHAAAGRQRDARRLAQRLRARPDVDEETLDRQFAGRPRSVAWPGHEEARPRSPDLPAGSAPPGAGDHPPAPSAPAVGAGHPGTAPRAGRPSDDIAAAQAALGRGDALAAAGLLAVALREEPVLAAMVLSVAEDGLAGAALAGAGRAGPAAAALHLVRGDALRLLGRTSEASAAFQGSRRALIGAAPREEST